MMKNVSKISDNTTTMVTLMPQKSGDNNSYRFPTYMNADDTSTSTADVSNLTNMTAAITTMTVMPTTTTMVRTTTIATNTGELESPVVSDMTITGKIVPLQTYLVPTLHFEQRPQSQILQQLPSQRYSQQQNQKQPQPQPQTQTQTQPLLQTHFETAFQLKQASEQQPVEEVQRISSAKKATPTPIPTTATTTATTTPAVKSKLKSVENKWPSVELANVSNQREFEANGKECRTLTGAHAIRNWITQTNLLVQCELLEYERYQKGSLGTILESSDSCTSLKRLAEKKAKLKLDFFKETLCKGDLHGTTATATATAISKAERSCDQDKLLGKPAQILSTVNKVLLAKRLLNRHKHTKLGKVATIKRKETSINPNSSITASQSTEHSVECSNRAQLHSLVTQRKLALKRRLEYTDHTEANCSRTVLALRRTAKNFPRVQQLVKKFDSQPCKHEMIVNSQLQSQSNSTSNSSTNDATQSTCIESEDKVITFDQGNSPFSDEGCNLGQSPYSSDEDNVSIRTTSTTIDRTQKRKEKVARSASSDSALGLDVDDSVDGAHQVGPPSVGQQQRRRMTLTVTDLPLRPALLPLAEPTALPDSPTTDLRHSLQNLHTQSLVPSKVLLEERVVEIPEDHRRSIGSSFSSSRRESSQSCISDYPNSESGGIRVVRTPSVVVSDYSDDIMCGVTLEEIEYFRAHRLNRRRSSLETAGGIDKDVSDGNSDVSAASSCSNLYYCGSTISALDGAECYVNGMRLELERKMSDCSACSASGGEEDVFTIPEQTEEPCHMSKELADLLAAQHLSAKRAKKVGATVTVSDTGAVVGRAGIDD